MRMYTTHPPTPLYLQKQGTADHSKPAERTKIEWSNFHCVNQMCGSIVEGYSDCPGEMGPYMVCPNRRRKLAQSPNVLCSDKTLVLSEPINSTVARLTAVFCDIQNYDKDVGLEFAGQILASLDADKNGQVTCGEWQIAKMEATIEQLVTYVGPKSVGPPACKMSQKGAETLARYNAYLAKLTLASLKVNATGVVTAAVENAATRVDGHVRGNAVVGKLLDAKDEITAKLNASMSG